MLHKLLHNSNAIDLWSIAYRNYVQRDSCNKVNGYRRLAVPRRATDRYSYAVGAKTTKTRQSQNRSTQRLPKSRTALVILNVDLHAGQQWAREHSNPNRRNQNPSHDKVPDVRFYYLLCTRANGRHQARTRTCQFYSTAANLLVGAHPGPSDFNPQDFAQTARGICRRLP